MIGSGQERLSNHKSGLKYALQKSVCLPWGAPNLGCSASVIEERGLVLPLLTAVPWQAADQPLTLDFRDVRLEQTHTLPVSSIAAHIPQGWYL